MSKLISHTSSLFLSPTSSLFLSYLTLKFVWVHKFHHKNSILTPTFGAYKSHWSDFFQLLSARLSRKKLLPTVLSRNKIKPTPNIIRQHNKPKPNSITTSNRKPSRIGHHQHHHH